MRITVLKICLIFIRKLIRKTKTVKDSYKPKITLILIAINAIVFLIECAHGDSNDAEVVLNLGATYTPYIFENGEWYRIFTAMFLHFGVEHIAGNMIALLAVGQYIEWYFGTVRYLVIYLISGLLGNLLFIGYEVLTVSDFAVSAGASGAISGLFGAFVILALDPRTRKYFSMPRILVGLALLLIPSFGDHSVNIIAHLGGIIGGFITGYIFYKIMQTKNSYILEEPPVQNVNNLSDEQIISDYNNVPDNRTDSDDQSSFME